MAQMRDQDVQRAIAEAASARKGEPLVRPEQVERIRAITSEPDPAVRAGKMKAWIAEMREALEANGRRLGELRQEAGASPGEARQFREGDRLSAAAKADLQKAIEAEMEEVQAAVAREAMGTGSRSARPPGARRAGHIRV